MRDNLKQYVEWFRHSSPYIHAHRGRTFVIAFGGEAVADTRFASLIHDVALLNSLGVRLVLVHGARPQIEGCLRQRGAELRYVNGLRITDDHGLICVKEAAGRVRMEIEALLSMGLANSPMAGAHIRVASGNFVTAQPLGVREGVDYRHTGEVRRVDTAAIGNRLDQGAIVLLSPIGYSPTGEIFNLSAEEVATASAIALRAEKLVLLGEAAGLVDAQQRLVRQITLAEAERLLASREDLTDGLSRHLTYAIRACRAAVGRTHLISRHIEGTLLLELFTRDGIGTLVTAEPFDKTRPASIDDVGGILELITPLEKEGILVRRPRELLEMEIERFLVMERDGMIIACTALYPFVGEAIGELACLAIHPDYRGAGRGDALLIQVEQFALKRKLTRLVVLTTRTAHWFQERGFAPGKLTDLPARRQEFYNYQRNSKVFIKTLAEQI